MKLTIGENIRSFRRKNDMTQEQLAQRLGVTYQSVSRWENGTTYPDLELLPAISELLSGITSDATARGVCGSEMNAHTETRRYCRKYV